MPALSLAVAGACAAEASEVASEVDREIRALLEGCYAETKKILQENDAAFERVAQALLRVETLDGDQFERLFTGEADPETIRQEIESENKEIARKNKKEAEEAKRIEEEENRLLKEELKKLNAAAIPDDREVVSFEADDKDLK